MPSVRRLTGWRRFFAVLVLALIATTGLTLSTARAQTGINGAQQGYNAGTWIGPYSLPNPNTGGVVGDITGINGAMSAITTDTAAWGSKIFGFAQTLFWCLVVIDIFWMGVQHIMFKENLGELLATFALKVMAICFYFFFFVQNGGLVASMIVNSFSQIGTSLGGATSPGSLLSQGLGYASPMIAAAWYFSLIPTGGVSLSFGNYGLTTQMVCLATAFMVAGAFAILAAQLLLVTIECYIVATAGLIMTAFTGSKFTLSFGEKYFSYAISVGVKLMMIYLIAQIASDMAGNIFPNLLGGTILTVVTGSPFPLLIGGFGAVVLSIVSWNAPAFASSILNGSSSISAGQAIGSIAGMIQGAGLAQMGMNSLSSANKTHESHQLSTQEMNKESNSNATFNANAASMAPAPNVQSAFLPSSSATGDPAAAGNGSSGEAGTGATGGGGGGSSNAGATSLGINTGAGASALRAQHDMARGINAAAASLNRIESTSSRGAGDNGVGTVGTVGSNGAPPPMEVAALPPAGYAGDGSGGAAYSPDSFVYGDSGANSGPSAASISAAATQNSMQQQGYAPMGVPATGAAPTQAENVPYSVGYIQTMSPQQLNAYVNERGLTNSSYEQLQAIEKSESWGALGSEKQAMVNNEIAQRDLAVRSGAANGMSNMGYALRSIAPPDQANGGAVSIRLSN